MEHNSSDDRISDLDRLLREHENPEIRKQFLFLEENRKFLKLFLEYPGDVNDPISDMLTLEPFYITKLKKEYIGVSALTPMAVTDHLQKLVKMAYDDLRDLPEEALKIEYN